MRANRTSWTGTRPILVYLDSYIRTATLMDWEVHETAYWGQIHAVYSYLVAATEETGFELLCGNILGDDIVEVAFRIWVEMWYRRPSPNIYPLQGMGSGPCFDAYDKREVPIYAWASDTMGRQAPISVRLKWSWILTPGNNVEVNKVTAVNKVVWEAEHDNPCLTQEPTNSTDRLWAPQDDYIPWWLLPELLTVTHTPRKVWKILFSTANIMRI